MREMNPCFAVSTFLFHQSRLDRDHLVDIAAHGFGGVELFALRSHFDYGDARAVTELAEWLDDTRLQLSAVHAPTADSVSGGVWSGHYSVASTDAGIRTRTVAEVLQTLKLASIVPFRTLVLHLGVPEQAAAPGDNDASAVRRSLEAIVPAAAEFGVQVALEVLTNALSTPDALVALIEDAADWGAAGICLDVGHARLLGDPVDAIETASGHIVASHVHDTHGYPRRPSRALRWFDRLGPRVAGLPEGGLRRPLDVRAGAGGRAGRHAGPGHAGTAALRTVSRNQ